MNNVIYSVPDWDAKFETHDSRKLKKLTWLAVNISDTDHYAELAAHQDGAAHLGCWLAVLMTAARNKTRGTLTRTNGQPHTAATLSLVTRLPEALSGRSPAQVSRARLSDRISRYAGGVARPAGGILRYRTLHYTTHKTGEYPTRPDTT